MRKAATMNKTIKSFRWLQHRSKIDDDDEESMSMYMGAGEDGSYR
jgi:hypothetical protein